MKITLDEGYQFGLGVFETIAVEQNRPLLLEEHLERLHHSLCALHINKTIKADEVFDFLSGHNLEHHALKLMVSAENTLFTVRPNPYPAYNGTVTVPESTQMFHLSISSVRRNETSPLVFHKTMNYADNLLEKRRVLRPSDLTSMDECFVTNSLMGIMPVQSLDSYTFHPYGMYADIQNFYAEYVRLHRTP